MYLKNYSVRVFKSNGQTANEQNGYVSLVNGEQYKLRLKNQDNRQCVCKVTIDGKVMGQFLVDPNRSVDLERPAHDSGKFTFYTIDSKEGKQLGLATEVKPSELGLVSVDFVPIKNEPMQVGYRPPPFPSQYGSKTKSSKMFLSRAIPQAAPAVEYSLTGAMDFSDEMGDLHIASASNLDGGLYDRGMDFAETPKKAGGTGLSGESNVDYKQVDITPDRFLMNEMATINLRLVAVQAYETVRQLTAVPNATPIPAPV